MGILVDAELLAESGLAVLGMGQENAGQLFAHGDADILAHRPQRIADGGGDDAVQQVQGAVQQHLQIKLRNGTVERGAIFLGAGDGLVIAAPHAERHHAGGGHQLLGRVIRHHADALFALRLEFLQLCLRVGRDGGELLYNRFDAHARASFSFLFSSIASTRPWTRVSY
ncbi:hypothetical protein SDC9_83146 [bioreactor metagenome]|uniref:Uncharacterized protein n=1 Tax=bioreactor metagenome TaxID=1076179 RepID=A0A644Z7E9_9ZZZZ